MYSEMSICSKSAGMSGLMADPKPNDKEEWRLSFFAVFLLSM